MTTPGTGIEVELEAEDAAAVAALATVRGCSRSAVIEDALNAYLASLDDETREQIERDAERPT